MSTTNPSIVPPRQRILLAAHDLFYHHGIRATGIDRVISAAGVTKVTFYRSFASKQALIEAYLEYRHERWITWFDEALQRHGGNLTALPLALEEWLSAPDYRGCAFINSVSELADQPGIAAITRHHKQDMQQRIAGLLPRPDAQQALALSLMVDGAIIRAQFDTVAVALAGLRQVLAWQAAS